MAIFDQFRKVTMEKFLVKSKARIEGPFEDCDIQEGFEDERSEDGFEEEGSEEGSKEGSEEGLEDEEDEGEDECEIDQDDGPNEQGNLTKQQLTNPRFVFDEKIALSETFSSTAANCLRLSVTRSTIVPTFSENSRERRTKRSKKLAKPKRSFS